MLAAAALLPGQENKPRKITCHVCQGRAARGAPPCGSLPSVWLHHVRVLFMNLRLCIMSVQAWAEMADPFRVV